MEMTMVHRHAIEWKELCFFVHWQSRRQSGLLSNGRSRHPNRVGRRRLVGPANSSADRDGRILAPSWTRRRRERRQNSNPTEEDAVGAMALLHGVGYVRRGCQFQRQNVDPQRRVV